MAKCVPAADDPNHYRAVSEAQQRKLEYRLVHGAMMETGFRKSMEQFQFRCSVQGMYVITPSGKLLAGGNNPFNAEFALSDLKKGLEAYAKMPRTERLLGRAPDPKEDRIDPERIRHRPPADGLVLQVISRGLDESVGERSDLAPKLYRVDRLWYTREEAAEFLPESLRRGQKKEITGQVLNGLAQLYLIVNHSHWDQRDVKKLNLNSEVVESRGTTIRLKLTGSADMDANDRFNQSKYRPDFLGELTYDTTRQTFTQFDLVAYGKFEFGLAPRQAGSPDSVPLAVVFRLNGSDMNDDQTPTKLEQYPSVKLKSTR